MNKRETSIEGLSEKFENGLDGVHNLITDNHNQLLSPKISISANDIAAIPPLKQLREAIAAIESQISKASGKRKYLLKKQLIEMRQEQYIIKSDYNAPIHASNIIKSLIKAPIPESITIECGEPVSDAAVSLFDPDHVCALLCNYSALKEESWGVFQSDIYHLMADFDNLIELTLAQDYPLYYRLLILKIDGVAAIDIQKILNDEFHINHTVEYISALWRNKIPKLIAEKAKEQYISWYYTNRVYGSWKKCSKCGEIKLAHNRFFSKNSTSKDGWYSICKCCRNAKHKKGE